MKEEELQQREYYKRNGKDCILCLSRKKLIQITPEELVRQQIIKKLLTKHHIPLDMIDVEVPISRYVKGKRGRVDIIVSGFSSELNAKIPLILIECKAPNVDLVDKVFDQVANYDSILESKIIVLTNGSITDQFYWDDELNQYKILKAIPQYTDLIKGEGIELETEFIDDWTRLDHKDKIDKNRGILLNEGNIGEDTDLKLVSFITNLAGLILDKNEKIDTLNLQTKRFISDGELRYTTFGNATGEGYPGIYRYIFVETEPSGTDLVSFSIFGNASFKNDPIFGNRKGTTLLMIAIDNFEHSHISIEYSIDRFVKKENEFYSFWHDGTLTNGKKGRCKNQDVINFIKTNAPYLVKDNKIYLGTLDNNNVFSWQDKNVIQLFSNFIDYAFLRDMFRETILNK